jgi:hypothetical protein
LFRRKKEASRNKEEEQASRTAKLRQSAADVLKNPKVRRGAAKVAKDPRVQRKAQEWASRAWQRFRRR